MWSWPWACLPFIPYAVTIDGAPCWDGGAIGNPALFPLIDGRSCAGIAVAQINPLVRRGTPCSAREILNRVNEITVGASLLQDLATIQLTHRRVMEGKLASREYRDMPIHIIDANNAMASLSASSSFRTGWEFLILLRDNGRRTAGKWTNRHVDSIGQHSTADLASMFRGSCAEALT